MKHPHHRKELVMKCEDLLGMLSDYVDGEIDPSLCAEFEAHMAGCNPCQVVIDNIRQTITLYKNGAVHELPIAFRQRLHAVLREKWRACHLGAPTAESETTPRTGS